MDVRSVLSRFLTGEGTVVVVECRRCGASVDPETDTCPECGGAEFCRYEIP